MNPRVRRGWFEGKQPSYSQQAKGLKNGNLIFETGKDRCDVYFVHSYPNIVITCTAFVFVYFTEVGGHGLSSFRSNFSEEKPYIFGRWICSHQYYSVCGGGPDEPESQGVKLTRWLWSYDPHVLINNPEEVDEAIREIGTNAVPTLLKMISAKDSEFRASVLNSEERFGMLVNRAGCKNVEAARGFGALDPAAKDSVHSLIKIYADNVSEESRQATLYALGGIGPDAKDAIPCLLQAVTNTQRISRYYAVTSLGQIHSEPSLCVPALIAALSDGDKLIRYEAALALGRFGTNASVAVPELINAIRHKDSGIKTTAIESLKAIALDAAALIEIEKDVSTNRTNSN